LLGANEIGHLVLNPGFAAGCEAGLRPAGVISKGKWATPWVRALPFTSHAEQRKFLQFYNLTQKGEHLMAHRFLISQDSPALYITVVTKDRLPVFRTDCLKEILCSAITEARNSAHFLLFAYVIMLDHLHLLTSRPSTTSELLRMVKGISARRVINYLIENSLARSLAKLQHQEQERNYKYSLWQTEKNVLPVFSEGMFMEKVNYIHQNPVRGGLAQGVLDYRWSSARIWRGCPLENEPLCLDKDLIQWRQSIRAR
jgi:putative transposase